MKKKVKAISLVSGGLDSAIATKLVMDQGIDCIIVYFSFPFWTGDNNEKSYPEKIAMELNVTYKSVKIGEDFFEIIKNPKHGYGKGINPCIDCKIYMLSKAKKLMQELDAQFIITGEVVGQRPMSQHKKALEIIEKKSGLQGKILRPLSAWLLDPTEPEKKGIINRDKLLSISGKSRKKQIDLSKKLNINEYAAPAGGCLLTEKVFSVKVKDLFKHKKNIKIEDIFLLKLGRHFRFYDNKIIVGRDKNDNKELELRMNSFDYIFEVPNYGSPITLLQGKKSKEAILFAAQLTAFYSKCNNKSICVKYGKSLENEITVKSLSKEEADKYNLAF